MQLDWQGNNQTIIIHRKQDRIQRKYQGMGKKKLLELISEFNKPQDRLTYKNQNNFYVLTMSSQKLKVFKVLFIVASNKNEIGINMCKICLFIFLMSLEEHFF